MALKIGRGAAAPPFIVMDVITAANAHQAKLPPGAPHVIRMEVGQPGTGAPAGAVAAVADALRSGAPLGYTEALGRRSLRARIAAHYADWYGLAVPEARIAVTVGASGGFPLAFLAAFDPGDRVALTAPFYPPYVNILTALGIQPVILEARADTRFQPSVAMLERLDPPPDGLIVASPCNPAGTMLHPEELAAIAAWCDRTGVRLISDEIYHGLNYASPIASAASFSPHAVVVNSFSKYFSMTGWRVGWLLLPEDLVRPV
jgi:aspartate/methionine/tyrosine aminotransferase